MRVIKPQKVQLKFLSSKADIGILGGAAGGGKTWALLMEPLRHIHNPKFSAIVFRRESRQIHLPGGLFDTALELYPGLGATFRQQPMVEFTFPRGSKVVMSHLNLESDVSAYQGSQIPLICWDELCHYSKSQFMYMMSRNRSACGVKPYMRASCNPDPDSWVADFIRWWLDQDTGFPIWERSGLLRYFITVPRENDTIQIWGDTPHDAIAELGLSRPSDRELEVAQGMIDAAIQAGEDIPDEVAPEPVIYAKWLRSAKSVTFVPARIHDNPELLKVNPEYIANLKALPRVERARLLDGNWKVRLSAGLYFAKADARLIPDAPTDVVRWLRSWDLAATEPNDSNKDPDWTVGMKLGRRPNGRVVIADVIRVRKKASIIRELVLATALADGPECWIQVPQDPGQAGKEQIDSYRELLRGFALFSRTILRKKTTVAEPAAAAWQRGTIELVVAPWNEEVLSELDRFPTTGVHDDCADALSGGFNLLPSASTPDYRDGGLSRKYRHEDNRT